MKKLFLIVIFIVICFYVNADFFTWTISNVETGINRNDIVFYKFVKEGIFGMYIDITTRQTGSGSTCFTLMNNKDIERFLEWIKK